MTIKKIASLLIACTAFLSPVYAETTVSVAGAASSDWQVGYCYVFTVTNPTSANVTDWTLHFVLPDSQINQSWEGDYTHIGTAYTVRPLDWNKPIASQHQAYASFCADGSKKPEQISLDFITDTNVSGTVTDATSNTTTTTGGTTTGGTTTGTTGGTTTSTTTGVTIPLAVANADGILLRTSFETDNWMNLLPRGNSGSLGKTYTAYFTDTWRDTKRFFKGKSSLGWKNRAGSHLPYGYEYALGSQNGALYLRYYRKYELGFEFKTEAKGHALAARKDYLRIGAGVRPNGYDNYDCRFQIMQDNWYDNASRKTISWGDVHQGEPVLYCYHLDQITQYGDKFRQNIGAIKLIKAGEWHLYEMMFRPNDAGQKNGEVKMWLDGELKLQRTGLEFRKTNDLDINILELGTWAGGSAPAPRDQAIYDDSLVLSKRRVGVLKANMLEDYPKK